MFMYMKASGKAMVGQWDQKAIARKQLCSSKMLSNVTLLHPHVQLWLCHTRCHNLQSYLMSHNHDLQFHSLTV